MHDRLTAAFVGSRPPTISGSPPRDESHHLRAASRASTPSWWMPAHPCSNTHATHDQEALRKWRPQPQTSWENHPDGWQFAGHGLVCHPQTHVVKSRALHEVWYRPGVG